MKLKILAIATLFAPLSVSAAVRAEAVRPLLQIQPCNNCQLIGAAETTPDAQEDWQEFSSSEGGFVVLMPGTPEEETHTEKAEEGDVEQHLFTAATPDGVFLVSYADFANEIDRLEAKELLDAATEGYITDGAKLIAQRPISLHGSPGREIKYKDSDGSIGQCRIFLVNKRLYQVSTLGSNTKDVQKFFGSFQLVP
ncbi:hypothetical protein H6F78_02430 [Coleofasciculus sp. FACHB-64]|uniref:hypothetical protein n=1 Tax=Cyanophyceae TaxID=3028117 RepID=UPI001682A7F3|nr:MULTISPECIES: hypothetical protein [unclassified Coleofasciculus]MBD1837921.1 hypothetical protein [Coleofasciculus sp. FACHB-501]MBD2044496.1 hypothetical protein [Coleofasciculus sp. FACHB-64]